MRKQTGLANSPKVDQVAVVYFHSQVAPWVRLNRIWILLHVVIHYF